MEKTCTQLGMTVNDTNNKNHSILCNAINEGITIVFDGVYTVNVNSTKYITNNINIKSLNKNYGMDISCSVMAVFNYSSDVKLSSITSTEVVGKVVKRRKHKWMHRSSKIKTMSEVTKTTVNGVNININGITITNLETSAAYLINIEDEAEINNINVVNCVFKDNIGLIRFVGSLEVDPASTNVGFNDFTFNYNEVYDTRTSFIVLTDTKFNNVEICHNKVNNFDKVFANIGVTNEHEYQEEIVQYRKNATVSYNEVICDDDWWHDTTSTTTYMTFLLIENNTLRYSNNHVEGMKSESSVSLYDLYASSMDVTCENNVWKNNLVFDPECIYNVLMKAKGSDGYKRYYNNEYYAEESFINRMGYTRDDIYLKLYDNVSIADWEIIGNKIECCSLYGMTSGSPFSRLVFEDNIMNVGSWDYSSLFCLRDNTDLYIRNNNITITDIYDQFYLLMVSSDSDIDTIDMQDNNFTLVFNTETNQQLLYMVGANNAVIKNNTFDIYADVKITFEYYCEYYESSDVTNNALNIKALDEYVG